MYYHKIYHLNDLSVQFSSIMYIPIVVQPISRTFHLEKLKLQPLNNSQFPQKLALRTITLFSIPMIMTTIDTSYNKVFSTLYKVKSIFTLKYIK